VPNEVEKLDQLRRLRRWVWVWPVTILPAALAGWLTPRPMLALAGIAIWWTGAFTVSVLRMSSARCPRCGERFYGSRILFGGKACASCGMRLKERHVVYPTLE
jgi:ribosomal protein L37E